MTAEMNSSDVMEKLTKQNIPLLNIQDVDYSQATETATSKRNRSKQDPLSLRPGLITRTDHNQSQTKTSSANSSGKLPFQFLFGLQFMYKFSNEYWHI